MELTREAFYFRTDRKDSFQWNEQLSFPFVGKYPDCVIIDKRGKLFYRKTGIKDADRRFNNKAFPGLKKPLFNGKKPIPATILWYANFLHYEYNETIEALERGTGNVLFRAPAKISIDVYEINFPKFLAFLKKLKINLEPNKFLFGNEDLKLLVKKFVGYTLGDMYRDGMIAKQEIGARSMRNDVFTIPSRDDIKKQANEAMKKRMAMQLDCLQTVTRGQLEDIGFVGNSMNCIFDITHQ